MELAAKFYVVGSNCFAEVIHDLVDVIDQLVRPAGNANDKAVEIDLGNTFDARCAGENPWSAVRAGGETQVGEARLLAAQWLVKRGIESKIAQAKLVDTRSTEALGRAQSNVVRLSLSIDAEPRVYRSISWPVGIDAVIAIEIVVRGQKTGEARIGIDPSAELVVGQIDLVRGGREDTGPP